MPEYGVTRPGGVSDLPWGNRLPGIADIRKSACLVEPVTALIPPPGDELHPSWRRARTRPSGRLSKVAPSRSSTPRHAQDGDVNRPASRRRAAHRPLPKSHRGRRRSRRRTSAASLRSPDQCPGLITTIHAYPNRIRAKLTAWRRAADRSNPLSGQACSIGLADSRHLKVSTSCPRWRTSITPARLPLVCAEVVPPTSAIETCALCNSSTNTSALSSTISFGSSNPKAARRRATNRITD